MWPIGCLSLVQGIRLETKGLNPRANITSMNVSQRKKTNTLQIHLESEMGVSCSLNTEEIERLLRRLKINSSQFSSVQACPERKNVVYITFAPGVCGPQEVCDKPK